MTKQLANLDEVSAEVRRLLKDEHSVALTWAGILQVVINQVNVVENQPDMTPQGIINSYLFAANTLGYLSNSLLARVRLLPGGSEHLDSLVAQATPQVIVDGDA